MNAAPALCLATSFVIVSGCKMGPDYARPDIAVPGAFRSGEAAATDSSLADIPWWEVFDDPILADLISEALTNNYDLRIAIARIQQARAIELQTASPLYPQINYNGALGRGRNSSQGVPGFTNGDTSDDAAVYLSAAWELDLWGRIRRADEAALAQILAAEETRRAVMLSLVSSVAQSYIELLELDRELEIAKANVKSFQESLELFTQRAQGGVDSQLQVLRASANQAQVAANIPELQRLATIRENQISLLLGRDPGPIDRNLATFDRDRSGDIPVGLPSALLERRPDIRAAEQQLVAANARVGVAKADYFPRLSLTALLGKVSPELSDFTSGVSNAWSIAGLLTGPLFTGGRLRGQEAQAYAERDEARARYEQTVRTAFGEVSDALITRDRLVGVETELARQVQALNGAVEMSRQRYRVGRASYFEILDAQQQLYPAQASAARTRADRLIALIQLYRALGGGWNLDDAAWVNRGQANQQQ